MATQSRRGRSGDPNQGSGEHRSGPIAGTAVISGVTFLRKAVQFAEVDGLAMFEGDIVLGTVDEFSGDAGIARAIGLPESSIGITGQGFRWPNATIPYEIDPAMPNQQRITDAIAHWVANTRIRFVVRDASNAATFPDFVHFQSGGGCSSMVGRRGNRQDITLGTGCSAGNAIHEIGHSVGLWHEQSREDRDSFVRIEWANIDPAMSHNFDQHVTDGDDLGAYDYGSIMHYPGTAFSINGQPTIVPLQPLPAGVTMGQRTGLSAGDIAGVHMLYPLPTIKEVPKDPLLDPTFKEVPKDPLHDPTVKEVRKDPIQDPGPTIKEVRKDPIQDPTFKEVPKDPIHDPGPTIKEVTQDPTFKEVRKDPIQDPPTIKEVGRDPIGPGGGTLVEFTPVPIPGGRFGGGPTIGGLDPFVLAGASRAQFGSNDQALAEAIGLVQQLAEAIEQLQQQHSQLTEAYLQALANVEALQQGQG
jgi:hypothetical protein